LAIGKQMRVSLSTKRFSLTSWHHDIILLWKEMAAILWSELRFN
jgi:hypothetical protein